MANRGNAHLVEVDAEGLRWIKSSASTTDNSGCVEMTERGNDVLVRSSRNRVGARLSYPRHEWVNFLDWLRTNG